MTDKERFQVAYDKMAKMLDDCDAQCFELDRKEAAGEAMTSEEEIEHEQWKKEGRIPWRQKPELVAKIRKAAKKAARNEAMKIAKAEIGEAAGN